jgi:hypothetical protein
LSLSAGHADAIFISCGLSTGGTTSVFLWSVVACAVVAVAVTAGVGVGVGVAAFDDAIVARYCIDDMNIIDLRIYNMIDKKSLILIKNK